MNDYEGMEISVKIVVGRNNAEFGPGTSRLIQLIDEQGSVRHAAEVMDISYGKTWKIIRDVEDALGQQVVKRQQGGPRGGSAFVTEAGHELMRRYNEMAEDIKKYAEKQFNEVFMK